MEEEKQNQKYNQYYKSIFNNPNWYHSNKEQLCQKAVTEYLNKEEQIQEIQKQNRQKSAYITHYFTKNDISSNIFQLVLQYLPFLEAWQIIKYNKQLATKFFPLECKIMTRLLKENLDLYVIEYLLENNALFTGSILKQAILNENWDSYDFDIWFEKGHKPLLEDQEGLSSFLRVKYGVKQDDRIESYHHPYNVVTEQFTPGVYTSRPWQKKVEVDENDPYLKVNIKGDLNLVFFQAMNLDKMMEFQDYFVDFTCSCIRFTKYGFYVNSMDDLQNKVLRPMNEFTKDIVYRDSYDKYNEQVNEMSDYFMGDIPFDGEYDYYNDYFNGERILDDIYTRLNKYKKRGFTLVEDDDNLQEDNVSDTMEEEN